MKDCIRNFFAIIAVAALGLGVYNFLKQPATLGTAEDVGSKVFDRVISRGELRVGYLIMPPYMSRQAASDSMSGIFADVVEEMGRRLNLKVNWVEEVNIATLSEGLDAGRYDMIGFPLWPSAERSKKVGFSIPLLYTTVGCYVRTDDRRFDQGLAAINSEQIRVSTIDGEMAESIAKSDFPMAQRVALPPLSDYSQLLLQVVSKKADVAFNNAKDARRFMARNPSQLRELGSEPVRVFPECFVLPLGDVKFQSMIDVTVRELIENGFLIKALMRNGEDPQDYFMPARPYRGGVSK